MFDQLQCSILLTGGAQDEERKVDTRPEAPIAGAAELKVRSRYYRARGSERTRLLHLFTTVAPPILQLQQYMRNERCLGIQLSYVDQSPVGLGTYEESAE